MSVSSWKKLETKEAKKSLLYRSKGNGREPYKMTRPPGTTSGGCGCVIVDRNAKTLGSGRSMVRVSEPNPDVKLDVDLGNKKCACGWWELEDSPCSHAAAFSESRRKDITKLLSPHQTGKAWKAQWKDVKFGSSLSVIAGYQHKMPCGVLDAYAPQAKGRPKKRQRIPSTTKDFATRTRT